MGIQTKTHFHDLIDTPHLIDANDKLPGPQGEPGEGLTVREAIPLCELWWNGKGRYSMPDFGKKPDEMQVRSGIMMGLEWQYLDKQEMLWVLAQWYAHVAVPMILQGLGTSQDKQLVDVIDDIREKGKEVFDVLDTSSTHDPTARGLNDKKETDEWEKEYEEIERENKLLDAQGEQLNPKGKNDG